MQTYKILILEDDFEAVSKIMAELYKLEGHFAPYDFDVTVLSSSVQVKKLINPQNKDDYDVILLDRDCKTQGSFHDLDIEKFGPEKIISISSTPTWNEEANSRGIKRIVPKSFSDLEGFAKNVSREIKSILKKDNITSNDSVIILFLKGEGEDNSRRNINHILEMSDDELEEKHDYIQWIFPLNEQSNAVPSSPILTGEEINLIKDDLQIQDNLMKALDRIEQFYSNNNHWIEEYNHNHLRISRIIKSLSLLIDKEIAERFYNKIINRIGDNVDEDVITHWKDILKN